MLPALRLGRHLFKQQKLGFNRYDSRHSCPFRGPVLVQFAVLFEVNFAQKAETLVGSRPAEIVSPSFDALVHRSKMKMAQVKRG